MPKFGNTSISRLHTCHPDLIKVLEETIKHYDFTIIFGSRSIEEQFELYKKGRQFKEGKWVKIGKTVTNLDGKVKKSMHNFTPSLAVDIAPYPIDWNNIQRFKELAVVVKQAAKTVGVPIVWGGDWKSFKDYPHYELTIKG